VHVEFTVFLRVIAPPSSFGTFRNIYHKDSVKNPLESYPPIVAIFLITLTVITAGYYLKKYGICIHKVVTMDEKKKTYFLPFLKLYNDLTSG